MPFANEHSCRLRDPGGYDRFRRGTREHEGKAYSIIFGHPKDGGSWEEQAYRYAKDAWSAADARGHCRSHDGAFEAAADGEAAKGAHPERWNRALGKEFDADARYPAVSALVGLAAEFLGVPVKQIRQGGTSVPAVRMGSFLAALDEQLRDWELVDLRNLADWWGAGPEPVAREAPPRWRTVELNSRESRDFLIEGVRFLVRLDTSVKTKPAAGAAVVAARVVLAVAPSWYGLSVVAFEVEGASAAGALLERTWARAHELKFLRGEAFSLSGAFIPKTDETWGQVFLPEKLQDGLRRTVDRLNGLGVDMPNRGVLLAGPPGTGKTLSLRVARNAAAATFIWVSARDFYYAGAFGGLMEAFDLARELAPSILAFEDIDNWIGSEEVDLLKTELDGIGRSSGIVTCLTTNYLARLPRSLTDRPGRFHDIFVLDLPDRDVRRRMLAAWAPELEPDDVERALDATDGYSGAHVRELVNFASVLRNEEALSASAALERAIEKLREQRELIEAAQLEGSRYVPSKALTERLALPRRPHARPAAIMTVDDGPDLDLDLDLAMIPYADPDDATDGLTDADVRAVVTEAATDLRDRLRTGLTRELALARGRVD